LFSLDVVKSLKKKAAMQKWKRAQTITTSPSGKNEKCICRAGRTRVFR